MPCFKGLAVSIHTPSGPLPEHSIQKQARFSRISSYIAVPPPKIPADSTTSEQSTFAISITLLTPGLNVPYSAAKATPENPYPQPKRVGGLPTSTERGFYENSVGPYLPLTTSPNETIAAYIYFDGRPKEEVATLLRRGEETWVNSRWVGVPESEGGGLAEREFLFREVGLERWLNGLDLSGKDAAAKIEKRRIKIEGKKGRRRKTKNDITSDDEDTKGDAQTSPRKTAPSLAEKGALRYGVNEDDPLEQTSDSDDLFLSETDDSDDDPVPESAGQIKVALYRVLASGEIRRGEYSPQFDAHEGDEDVDKMDGAGNGSLGGDTTTKEEVDHTTSFAKPKTLDPSSISTQTVTGIDPQDRPFAVFTFLYRGEKQLQKMGILRTAPKAVPKTPLSNAKRRSMQDDFSKFKPLDINGLKKFSEMRDPGAKSEEHSRSKAGRPRRDDDSDEDLDTADAGPMKADDMDEVAGDVMLSPEDLRRQGELADGVQKIRLKRQHSVDLLGPSTAPATRSDTSPTSTSPTKSTTPPIPAPVDGFAPHASQLSSSRPQSSSLNPGPLLPPVAFSQPQAPTSHPTALEAVGSPLKKARSSMSGMGERDDDEKRKRFGLGLTPPSGESLSNARGADISGDVLGRMEHDRMENAGAALMNGTASAMIGKSSTVPAAPVPPPSNITGEASLLGGLLRKNAPDAKNGTSVTEGESESGVGGSIIKEEKMEEEEL